MMMMMILFLRKKFCGPTTRGPQELWGPSSLNRLNPRFLRHSLFLTHSSANTPLTTGHALGAFNGQ